MNDPLPLHLIGPRREALGSPADRAFEDKLNGLAGDHGCAIASATYYPFPGEPPLAALPFLRPRVLEPWHDALEALATRLRLLPDAVATPDRPAVLAVAPRWPIDPGFADSVRALAHEHGRRVEFFVAVPASVGDTAGETSGSEHPVLRLAQALRLRGVSVPTTPVDPSPDAVEPRALEREVPADAGPAPAEVAPEEPDTPVIGTAGASGRLLGTRPAAPEVPDTVLDAVDGDGFAVRAASCRGRSHRYANTHRQDAYCIGASDDASILVIAVADGVGSEPYSHVAARLVTQTATDMLVRRMEAGEELTDEVWDDVGRHLADCVADAASALAESLGRDAPDGLMAATLAVAAVRREADGRLVGRLGHLGDTSAWLVRPGRLDSITPVKNEGAEIATSRVQAFPRFDRLVTSELELVPGDALLLMSDGVGDTLGNGAGEVGARLASWWAAPPGLHRFGAQVDFQRRTFDDDRTVVGLWVGGAR